MLFTLLLASSARALPIPAIEFEPAASTSTCDDLQHCRTVWNIVWTCLVTISACTWVTVHPNVPTPDDSRFAITWGRVKIVLIALVMPELIVSWAIRQWLIARKTVRRLKERMRLSNGKYRTKDGKEREWTMAHGFMASMGGFVLSHEGQLRHPFDNKMIRDFIQNGYIDISITEKEINDKSKGDGLSKTLVILQTTWFAIQCVARGEQHLPVTKLEFVTLAFVTLNLATYILWWHKPLHVQCPVPVMLNTGYFPSLRRLRPNGNPVEDGKEHQTRGASRHGGQGIGGAILGPTLRWAQMVGKFATGDQDYGADLTLEKKVPIFYAGSLSDNRAILASFALAVVGIIFGAIHCIAWSSSFPSHVEQTLWRVSCVTITGVPGVYFMIYLWISFRRSTGLVSQLGDFQPLLNVVMPPLLFVYVIGRVTLFVLAFMSLRAIPPGAYETIHWMTFIPHI